MQKIKVFLVIFVKNYNVLSNSLLGTVKIRCQEFLSSLRRSIKSLHTEAPLYAWPRKHRANSWLASLPAPSRPVLCWRAHINFRPRRRGTASFRFIVYFCGGEGSSLLFLWLFEKSDIRRAWKSFEICNFYLCTFRNLVLSVYSHYFNFCLIQNARIIRDAWSDQLVYIFNYKNIFI